MPAFSFIEELLIILGVSLVATILFRRFRLPAIVAYIVVGAISGPHLFGWIADPHDFSMIAEFGVAFLLFSIGLEFSVSNMLKLKFAVFGLGTAQVLACSVIFAIAVYLWGTTINAAVLIAGALALSSTAIVIRELGELQQFSSRFAQLSIGILLFQDLVAVVFLILVPVMSGASGPDFGAMLLATLGKGLLFFFALMATGKWLLPLIYQEVARVHSDEIFGLSTLVIALITAWLAHAVELSMALGGFVIGMMLSESSFKHQIIIDIRPFKDVLLGLFFVTVGMNIDLSLLAEYGTRILLFTAGLVILKALIIAMVVRLAGEPGPVSLRIGLTLAQAGEFGLALITLASLNGVIPPEQASFIILIAVLSMLLSPALIRNSKLITEFLLNLFNSSDRDTTHETHPITLHQSGHALIGGFGRVGQTIAQLLDKNGIPYTGIDQNIEIVSECRERGNNVIYGDCTSIKLLRSCHIAEARLAVLTFRSAKLAKHTITEIRRQNIQIPIIVRCYEHGNFEELVSLGADKVISEMLEASLIISSQVLTILDIDPDRIDQQINEIRHHKQGVVK
jgi:CPA2 family monovalent cation:H+ antiporter-2